MKVSVNADYKEKYTVTIDRIGYSTRDIEVTATSKEEAKEKAIDMAGNLEFNEYSADYEVFIK